MRKGLAHIVSGLFHPLIMPSVGVLFVFFTTSQIFFLPFQAQRVILFIVALNTLVIPIIMMPILHKFGLIKSIQMLDHKERVIPLFFTLILYIFSFYFLARLQIVSALSLFMLGATLAVLLTTIISYWWKISIHMVGIGGLLGLIYVLALRFQSANIWILIAGVCIAGVIGWARLEVSAHKPSQIYAGFSLGILSVVSIFVWF